MKMTRVPLQWPMTLQATNGCLQCKHQIFFVQSIKKLSRHYTNMPNIVYPFAVGLIALRDQPSVCEMTSNTVVNGK